ncbi:MAG TPA: hypothetical protein VFM56_10835 [Solimonas sp.]|nr:hypothetical protein [Solimonas sp.]
MRRGLAIVAGAGLLIAAGGWLGFWLFAHLILGLTLSDQPGMVRFPPTTPATAVARNKVKIKLNGYIDAEVPFKQVLNLPLSGHYDAEASFDTVVPVSFTIRYRGAIPVDTMATIHGVTDFNYQKVKRLRNVAFTAQIPLRFEQPIALTVPVRANLHLVYRGPLGVHFNQTVSAPVDTTLHTRLLAVREIETPILARFGLDVHWPQTPVPVIISNADLRLRLNSLRLQQRDDTDTARNKSGT